MVQLDKSIHPVVLYEYYLICVFINIHENLKMREHQIKAETHVCFPVVRYVNLLICIFMNTNETLKIE